MTQIHEPPPPATPRPAATVLLLRDGADGLEVLMVVRHARAAFAPGALVFPGGAVDPEDAEAEGREADADRTPAEAPGIRVCAIRETFEECGILLARAKGATGLVDAERVRSITVPSDSGGFAAMLRREGLSPAEDLLVPFAHWITPLQSSRRFDTLFFAALAPADQVAAHDGRETVDSVWITPGQAIAAADRRERRLVVPTRLNLARLGSAATAAAALSAARATTIVPVVATIERLADGSRRVVVPASAGYGGELSFDEP